MMRKQLSLMILLNKGKYENEINKDSKELLQDFEVPSRKNLKKWEKEMKHLLKEIETDERIQRVSDIYDLMEEK